MKKIAFIVSVLMITFLGYGQKKEKIKGSKIVTIEKKEVGNFIALEIADEIEVSLVKGDKSSIEIEADDNLHEALGVQLNGETLVLTLMKEISGFKKFIIRVNYTDGLNLITAKNKAKVNALETLKLDEVTFKAFDNAKLFLNVDAKAFTLIANDKSKIELNVKSELSTIQLSKNAELKALVSSTQVRCDLYQKASAVMEGDAIDVTLRMDNNSNFTGKKFDTKKMNLVVESYANATVLVATSLTIDVSGNAEIQIYGDPKMELKKFADTATLYKKQIK
ncbi:MAG TPA: DUF2807 domain-containing protein [Flavobacterium sp.]|jgi:hypothetical protein